LKVFYQKVLCKVGWNKYNRIDVEFGNQIVCTKNE
ncbi:MAG: cell division protein FtsQ, partial [Bacteroidaceae bacterium]